MRLIAIPPDGKITCNLKLDSHVSNICEQTAEMYKQVGYQFPWVAYLAIFQEEHWVGCCAFKSAPQGAEVEVAYHTFLNFEGRGFATAMMQNLIQIAQQTVPDITLKAQTLPQVGASTRILKKFGFEFVKTLEHAEDGIIWEWKLKL